MEWAGEAMTKGPHPETKRQSAMFTGSPVRHLAFGIWHSFVIGHSSFVISPISGIEESKQ